MTEERGCGCHLISHRHVRLMGRNPAVEKPRWLRDLHEQIRPIFHRLSYLSLVGHLSFASMVFIEIYVAAIPLLKGILVCL